MISEIWAQKILDLEDAMDHQEITPSLVYALMKNMPRDVLEQAFLNGITNHVGKAAFAEILFRNDHLVKDWDIYVEPLGFRVRMRIKNASVPLAQNLWRQAQVLHTDPDHVEESSVTFMMLEGEKGDYSKSFMRTLVRCLDAPKPRNPHLN